MRDARGGEGSDFIVAESSHRSVLFVEGNGAYSCGLLVRPVTVSTLDTR